MIVNYFKISLCIQRGYFMLNEYEQKKYDTISKLVSKEITTKEAMNLLNLKECQIYRLKKIFKEYDKNGFIHGNRGKANPKKKDEKLINELEGLYLSQFYDYNFEHFYEDAVYGKYDISYDVMLKVFTKDDIISPLAHKKTIREYREKMNTVIKDDSIHDEVKDEKIELYKSRIIEAEKHILEDLVIFMYLVKKFKWMLVKNIGLGELYLTCI